MCSAVLSPPLPPPSPPDSTPPLPSLPQREEEAEQQQHQQQKKTKIVAHLRGPAHAPERGYSRLFFRSCLFPSLFRFTTRACVWGCVFVSCSEQVRACVRVCADPGPEGDSTRTEQAACEVLRHLGHAPSSSTANTQTHTRLEPLCAHPSLSPLAPLQPPSLTVRLCCCMLPPVSAPPSPFLSLRSLPLSRRASFSSDLLIPPSTLLSLPTLLAVPSPGLGKASTVASSPAAAAAAAAALSVRLLHVSPRHPPSPCVTPVCQSLAGLHTSSPPFSLRSLLPPHPSLSTSPPLLDSLYTRACECVSLCVCRDVPCCSIASPTPCRLWPRRTRYLDAPTNAHTLKDTHTHGELNQITTPTTTTTTFTTHTQKKAGPVVVLRLLLLPSHFYCVCMFNRTLGTF